MTSKLSMLATEAPPVIAAVGIDAWRDNLKAEYLVTATSCDIADVEEALPEDAAPVWIPCRFRWSDPERRPLTNSALPPTESCQVSHAAGDSEPSVADLVHGTLSRTGYPLHGIRCWSDQDALVLTGVTTQYYFVQIALTAAMRHAGHRRITNRIEVVPPRLRPERDGDCNAE